MGSDYGMTCCRRLAQWQHNSVWQKLHEVFLAEFNAAEWSIGLAQSPNRPACARLGGRRGDTLGPNPKVRGKLGCQRQLWLTGKVRQICNRYRRASSAASPFRFASSIITLSILNELA